MSRMQSFSNCYVFMSPVTMLLRYVSSFKHKAIKQYYNGLCFSVNNNNSGIKKWYNQILCFCPNPLSPWTILYGLVLRKEQFGAFHKALDEATASYRVDKRAQKPGCGRNGSPITIWTVGRVDFNRKVSCSYFHFSAHTKKEISFYSFLNIKLEHVMPISAAFVLTLGSCQSATTINPHSCISRTRTT